MNYVKMRRDNKTIFLLLPPLRPWLKSMVADGLACSAVTKLCTGILCLLLHDELQHDGSGRGAILVEDLKLELQRMLLFFEVGTNLTKPSTYICGKIKC